MKPPDGSLHPSRDPLRAAFELEWQQAAEARARNDLDRAFHHLERAHILGQRRTWLHLKSHVGMLRIGWLRRDAREVAGQWPRMLAALLFSRIWVPEGNTGGADVSALRPMPIPEDLRDTLENRDPSPGTLRQRCGPIARSPE